MHQDANREFYRALHSGAMELVIERHGNKALLRFLQYRNSLVPQLLSGFFRPYINYDPHTKEAENAWLAISNQVKTAPLWLLLEVSALSVSRLTHAIRIGMINQLSTATSEDLELLTASQRKELVSFTLEQLPALVTKAPHLEALRWQAATLGYLALATLKQPGAEHPDRRGLPINHGNLGKAIQEYHKALYNEGPRCL